MNWKIIKTLESGMLVEDQTGRQYLVDLAQKRTLVAVGVLAVRAQDNEPEPEVTLLAGAVDGLDRDTLLIGCLRDAALVELWRALVP